MVARILIFASAACVFNLANGLSEPFPGFHPCKTSDNECLLDNAIKGVETFANGIPSLDVKRMDPVTFKKIDASSPNLKFILHNIVITGLKSCKPANATRDTAKSEMSLVLQCTLTLDGDYEMDGKLLILTINGHGKIHVLVKNMVNKVTLHYIMKEGKDGKKYMRVKNVDHSYELKEKSDVKFEGLFQDSAVLSQAADDLVKNNGNEIIQEIGNPMLTAAVKEIADNINRFLGKIPDDEITLY